MTHLKLVEDESFAQAVSCATRETQEIQQAVASSAEQSVSLSLIGRGAGVATSDWSSVTRVPRSEPYF